MLVNGCFSMLSPLPPLKKIFIRQAIDHLLERGRKGKRWLIVRAGGGRRIASPPWRMCVTTWTPTYVGVEKGSRFLRVLRTHRMTWGVRSRWGDESVIATANGDCHVVLPKGRTPRNDFIEKPPYSFPYQVRDRFDGMTFGGLLQWQWLEVYLNYW